MGAEDAAPLYDPGRKSLRVRGVFEFTSENLNVAKQYLSDYVTGGDVESEEKIAAGEGAVMGYGPNKVAVYKDEQEQLHRRSALLGCIVTWNSLEKSWDCPCHGSRYDRYGEVITGPANKGLSPVEE